MRGAVYGGSGSVRVVIKWCMAQTENQRKTFGFFHHCQGWALPWEVRWGKKWNWKVVLPYLVQTKPHCGSAESIKEGTELRDESVA